MRGRRADEAAGTRGLDQDVDAVVLGNRDARIHHLARHDDVDAIGRDRRCAVADVQLVLGRGRADADVALDVDAYSFDFVRPDDERLLVFRADEVLVRIGMRIAL